MFQVLALWVGLAAPAAEGKLLLTTEPDDATVEVNGDEVKGFRSGKAVSVPAGRLVIKVSASGYEPAKKTVEVAKGKTAKVNIRLAKSGGKSAAPVAKRPLPVGKPGVKPTPRPTAKPTVKPSPRPVAKPAPTAKPRPISRPADDEKKPAAKPIGRPVEPKPKADAKPKPRPKDGGPRPKVKDKDKDDRPRPKTKGDARPRPVRKPGGGYDDGPHGARDDYRGGGPMRTKPLAIVSFVIGGLAVTGGVVAGLAANESADKFSDADVLADKRKFRDESENRALAANVLYGVGATGILLGAVLWAMDPGDGPYHGAQVVPLADGAMVGWGGTF